jgi:hypothetical protein
VKDWLKTNGDRPTDRWTDEQPDFCIIKSLFHAFIVLAKNASCFEQLPLRPQKNKNIESTKSVHSNIQILAKIYPSYLYMSLFSRNTSWGLSGAPKNWIWLILFPNPTYFSSKCISSAVVQYSRESISQI